MPCALLARAAQKLTAAARDSGFVAPETSPRADFGEEILTKRKSTEWLSPGDRKVLLLTPTPRAALAFPCRSLSQSCLFQREKATEVTGLENGVRISQHGMPKI